jgi:hypothetical protein
MRYRHWRLSDCFDGLAHLDTGDVLVIPSSGVFVDFNQCGS